MFLIWAKLSLFVHLCIKSSKVFLGAGHRFNMIQSQHVLLVPAFVHI